MTGPPPPLTFLIDNLLAEDFLTLLVAPGGIGKSLIALYAAIAVGLGLPFLGLETRRRRVLYVDFELPAVVQQRMGARILNGLGIAPDDARLDDIVHYAPLHFLSTPAGLQELQAAAEGEGAGLLVLDSLTLGASGADPSSAAEMMPTLLTLSRSGRTVLCLDHVTKSAAAGQAAATPFGSAMKSNAARAVLNLTRKSDKLVLAPSKWNLSAPPPPLEYTVEFERDEGAIRFHRLRADLFGSLSEPAGSGAGSDDLTLAVLVELHHEIGGAAGLAEVAARRRERAPGSSLTDRTVANQLSRLKGAGLAHNPSPGRWAPVTRS